MRQGDTLWDLAKQYRGDPFLWPDIYRMNTAVVEDPHWIYPGEVLRLSGAEEMAAVPPSTRLLPPPRRPTPLRRRRTPPRKRRTPCRRRRLLLSPRHRGGGAPGPSRPPARAGRRLGHEATLAELAQARRSARSRSPSSAPGPRARLQETILAYTKKEYRPLRKTEFYSSGFLTENQKLPWAKVIGPVTPSQIGATTVVNDAMPFATIAIEASARRHLPDRRHLLLAHRGRGLRPFGEAIMPTGLATSPIPCVDGISPA